jgi:hypothetical protein
MIAASVSLPACCLSESLPASFAWWMKTMRTTTWSGSFEMTEQEAPADAPAKKNNKKYRRDKREFQQLLKQTIVSDGTAWDVEGTDHWKIEKYEEGDAQVSHEASHSLLSRKFFALHGAH